MKSKDKNKLIGAGIGMAALAAAGTYFLYGKKGSKNREKIAGWTLKMKGEVLEKMENLHKLDQETYHKLVDATSARYARVKKASASELKTVTADLKSAWTHIGKQLN